MSRRPKVTPILFSETFNYKQYCDNIVYSFIAQLKEDEIDKAYFQQYGATALTVHMSVALLDNVLADRIISKTIWPPVLCQFDFFFWGALKNSLYFNNLHTIDDLKMAITEYIRSVDRAILNTVFQNTVQHVNNVGRLAGKTVNITCKFLYCNQQGHREFLITLYMNHI